MSFSSNATNACHVCVQAKSNNTVDGAGDVMSPDKGTAISGIEKFVGELMRQDKKLTILKTLQVVTHTQNKPCSSKHLDST